MSADRRSVGSGEHAVARNYAVPIAGRATARKAYIRLEAESQRMRGS
jgi:hypothetical protein